jgi:hypothetical protein
MKRKSNTVELEWKEVFKGCLAWNYGKDTILKAIWTWEEATLGA